MSRVVVGLERWAGEGIGVTGLRPGDRVGILAHAASIDSEGRHVAELLPQLDVRTVRWFAPEHGLWGHEQDMEPVGAGRDPLTGLPVISLYGDSPASLQPSPEQLGGLDAIVVDLQDVGSRYYTFVYTLSFVMEAAAAAALPVVVLDRPNPIDGVSVEGPPLEAALTSFVGRYPLPVRHGMTIGELAELFNHAFRIGCELRVVEMRGWRRTSIFRETRLPWVAPSPNMPTPATAAVYPGGCLFEGTNLSEGRGTTTPFELIGAPWLNGNALALAMRRLQLDGVAFRAASFRPMFQKHRRQACGGVQVLVTDRRRFRPFATYLALLREARDLARRSFRWRRAAYEFESSRPAIDLLLGRADLRSMIERGAGVDEMERSWIDELREFERLRRHYLRYD